jgi:hypothetical protein
MNTMKKITGLLLASFAALTLSLGCASPPMPDEATSPTPPKDCECVTCFINTGKCATTDRVSPDKGTPRPPKKPRPGATRM